MPATLNHVILPIIRRVMPSIIANDIVGVQPMSGSVGTIYSTSVRYGSQYLSHERLDVPDGMDTIVDDLVSKFGPKR